MLRHYRSAPDGRMFRGTRGGPLSESGYGRTWHTARSQAFGPAAAATTLARRPCDLRHAALSLWLNTGAAPAQIAQRAGHSITVLLAVYTHCIDGQDDITNRQIEAGRHLMVEEIRIGCVLTHGPADKQRTLPAGLHRLAGSGLT
jgi:integrase